MQVNCSAVLFQSDEGSGRGGDALDISRLSESLARATCLALIKFLDLLAQAGLTKLGVRATVHPENVSCCNSHDVEPVPTFCSFCSRHSQILRLSALEGCF